MKDQGGFVMFPFNMTCFRKEVQNIDDEAILHLQENNRTMFVLQINVENGQEFEHFVLDSQKYSPYHNDQRVIVGD